MDKKKLMLLLGALVVAIGTAMAAKSLFTGAATPQAQAAQPVPQGPKVLVAQRALPVGTIITADSISFQAWPQEMVQDAYFIDGEADMNKLLGTVVRYPITAGQPVTQGALVSPGDRGFLAAALGPGMRAVSRERGSRPRWRRIQTGYRAHQDRQIDGRCPSGHGRPAQHPGIQLLLHHPGNPA